MLIFVVYFISFYKLYLMPFPFPCQSLSFLHYNYNVNLHHQPHHYIISHSQDIDHPVVYLALLPIIGGVGLASLKELSFTWTAFIAASGANQAAAFKNVVSKGEEGHA